MDKFIEKLPFIENVPKDQLELHDFNVSNSTNKITVNNNNKSLKAIYWYFEDDVNCKVKVNYNIKEGDYMKKQFFTVVQPYGHLQFEFDDYSNNDLWMFSFSLLADDLDSLNGSTKEQALLEFKFNDNKINKVNILEQYAESFD